MGKTSCLLGEKIAGNTGGGYIGRSGELPQEKRACLKNTDLHALLCLRGGPTKKSTTGKNVWSGKRQARREDLNTAGFNLRPEEK